MIGTLLVAIVCLRTVAARAIDAELSQQVWAQVPLASAESVWMLVDACTNEESAPAILVTAPPDAAVVRVQEEEPLIIRWRSCGHVPYVKLELVHKRDVVLLIDAGTKNDGVYNWSVQQQQLPFHLPLQDFYKVRVSSLHDASVRGETQGGFRIVRTIPHENVKELHFLHDKFELDVIP